MPRLTKTILDNAKPAATDVWLWDAELPGFGVRVQPSGRKTYVARYRTHSNTQRKQTIGRCSDFPPDKAREMARKIFAAVAGGEDPAASRTASRDAPTIEELSVRYMREHAGPFKKAKSADMDANNWRLHILPGWARKKVREVTRTDVLSLHGGLSLKPATANQVLALLSKAFNLAEDWGWRDRHSNPCERVKKYPVRQRELILSADQLKRLNATMDAMVNDGTLRPHTAALFRLLVLTGARKCEIMLAQRAWVDVDRQLLLLPDSKTGQKRIPLPDVAMAIIAQLPAGRWLIPGHVLGQPMTSANKAWSRIKERAGLPAELRIHDLRHTAGSWGHAAGLSQKEIADQLGHTQMATTERYLHGTSSRRSAVANRVAEAITAAWK